MHAGEGNYQGGKENDHEEHYSKKQTCRRNHA
jgi:hypothetical protein